MSAPNRVRALRDGVLGRTPLWGRRVRRLTPTEDPRLICVIIRATGVRALGIV